MMMMMMVMMMMMTKEGAGSVTQLWDALPAGGAMELSSHSLFLLQQLNVQREFGFLCDCTVAIGNVYFKAHRAVLAAFSNYFKMIFIHQSSECIKIQPTDIQPDVFSYLLHIMYTGTGPKQQVEQSRLQEGVRFLHAYPLFRAAGGASDSSTDADAVRMSNLYGIQISSQPAPKDCLGGKAGPEGGREVGGAQQERAWMRPSPVVALEPLSRTRTCSVASGDDSRVLRVKQECEEAELIQPDSPPPQQEATPSGEAPRDGRVKLVGIDESAIEGNSPGPPQLLEEVPPYGHNPTEDPGAELRGSRRRKIACGVCSRREPAAGLLMRCHRHHPHLSQVETKEEEPVRGAQDNGSSCYSLDSEISQESSDTAVAE